MPDPNFIINVVKTLIPMFGDAANIVTAIGKNTAAATEDVNTLFVDALKTYTAALADTEEGLGGLKTATREFLDIDPNSPKNTMYMYKYTPKAFDLRRTDPFALIHSPNMSPTDYWFRTADQPYAEGSGQKLMNMGGIPVTSEQYGTPFDTTQWKTPEFTQTVINPLLTSTQQRQQMKDVLNTWTNNITEKRKQEYEESTKKEILNGPQGVNVLKVDPTQYHTAQK